MKRLSIIPLAVLAVAPLTRVTAQEPPPVKVGERVRITAPDLGLNKHTGVLSAMNADTLAVDGLRVVLAAVTKLEVSQARRPRVVPIALGGAIGFGVGLAVGHARFEPIEFHAAGFYGVALIPSTVAGAAIGTGGSRAIHFGALGMLAGAGVGAVIAAATYELVQDISRGISALEGTATGAGIGLAVGATFGAVTSFRDRWEEVTLDRLRLSFAPQHDGRFAFGLSVRF